MPTNKFFYLAHVDFQSDNQVRIIRDSFPTLSIKLNKNDYWMESLFKNFFNTRAEVTILTDISYNSSSLMVYDNNKKINFNFVINSKKKQTEQTKEQKEKIVTTRLAILFEHNEIVLQPHQEKGLNKLWKSKGELVFGQDDKKIHESWCWAHSTGSGKSYSSLSVFSKIPVSSVYIFCSNAALLQWAAYVCAMAQPTKSKTTFEIMGLTEFANRLISNEDRDGDEDFLLDHFVIFDEAHVFRNMTSVMKLQIEALRKARFLQTLTATLTVNHLSDIIALCEMHGGNLREDEIDEIKHNENVSFELIDSILERCFAGRIDWYDAKEDANASKYYAPTTIVIKEVEMSWEQTVDYMVKKRNNFIIGDLCLTTSSRNSYRKNQKQICNSSKDFSPKFELCCEIIDKFNKFPLIVYSNYLQNGVKEIYQRLKRKRPDLEVDIATGTTSTLDREAKRIAFNNKKMDTLLLSSIGNASLDFLGAKALILMESFDNAALEKQAIGRVCRLTLESKQTEGSLEPILIFKLMSIFPKKPQSEQEKQRITQYFYDTYCNPSIGTKEELLSSFDFIEELMNKIQLEENGQTVEQQLEIANVYKNNRLDPANMKFKSLGSR